MKQAVVLQVVDILLRVALGLWFFGSGLWKISVTGLDRFTRDIGNYRLVGPPLDAVAAYTVPWFEVFGGLFLVLGVARRGALLTLAGLVGVFAFCVGWAWVHRLDISCGCHGGDAKISYWGKALEFTLYFVVIGWLWWRESGRRGMDPANLA